MNKYVCVCVCACACVCVRESIYQSAALIDLLSDGAAMGWLRLVGSLKLQVSFAEYSLFYRALLQKRPVILRSLLIVSTPYLIDEQVDIRCT